MRSSVCFAACFFISSKSLHIVFAPLPEIFTRLAKIRTKQGKKKEAIKLYLKAKDFLAQRITYSDFFGDLNIMNWLVNDLCELQTLDITDDFDLFDLYYLLKYGNYTISFCYNREKYLIESVQDKGSCEWRLKFEDESYKNIEDFMTNAHIGKNKLASINSELCDFKVESIEIGKSIII